MAVAGKYRFKVSVERRGERLIEGGGGEQRSDWETVLAEYWVCITPQTARETLFANATSHDITHIIEGRYTKLITPDCRLCYDTPDGTHLFNIQGLINVEMRNRELQMTCNETTNDG